MSTFTPTHRTNRPIGKIKAGSPIRVAQYNDTGFFSDLLAQLKVKSHFIQYRYDKEDVQFWDDRDMGNTSKFVFPGDYLITDGEHFETSNTDNGWDLLTAEPPKPEGVTLSSWGDNIYSLQGDTGAEIKFTGGQLHGLVQLIQKLVPEPSPIKDARFIHAFLTAVTPGEYRTLAKVDDLWYDHNGTEYTEKQVLDNYDEIEVIR